MTGVDNIMHEFKQKAEIDGKIHNLCFVVDFNDDCVMIDADEVIEPNEKIEFPINYPFFSNDEYVVFSYSKSGGNWTKEEFACAIRDAYTDMYKEPYQYSFWHGLGELFLEGAIRVEPGKWELYIGS